MATAKQYVKDLPDDIKTGLAQVLDSRSSPNWRNLIQVLPSNMYRSDHVEAFAMVTLQPNGSPTLSLLNDLGNRNITVPALAEWIQRLPGATSPQIQSLVRLLQVRVGLDPPVITRHPAEGSIYLLGCNAVLSCQAAGQGPLMFQWFKSRVPLTGQVQPDLHLRDLRKEEEGYYLCRVANSGGYTFSNWAKVEVSEMSEVDTSHMTRPIVTTQPHNPEVQAVLGGFLRLYCDAMGDPAPTFQWYKDDIPIRNANQREYIKQNVCLDDEGSYICVASNASGNAVSKAAQVVVAKNSVQSPPPPVRRGESDRVSDKIALLIGNKEYNSRGLRGLYHPLNDVCDLAGVLTSIGFKVVSLVNLTLEEMRFALREFYKLLDKDMYALFYFAGHGFEVGNQSYLMPVSASAKYEPDENMKASEVLDAMQGSSAKLNVLVLDCCRTTPASRVDDQCYPTSLRISKKNVIVVFGCLPKQSVFECHTERNGYIAKHLLKHIGDEEKHVSQVFLDVSKGIDSQSIIDPNSGQQQIVYIQTTMVEDMSLRTPADPFRATTVGADGWKAAHDIPEAPVQVFEEDGLVVELLFLAEFSNVLLVNARSNGRRPGECHVFFSKPARISGCGVQEVTGKEPTIPRKLSRSDCGIRITDLQRLEGDLEFCFNVVFTSAGQSTTRRIVYKMQEKPLYAKIAARC